MHLEDVFYHTKRPDDKVWMKSIKLSAYVIYQIHNLGVLYVTRAMIT